MDSNLTHTSLKRDVNERGQKLSTQPLMVFDSTPTAPIPRVTVAWRWWIAPAALALVLAVLFLDPFIGDWDAVDYTLHSIEGRPSSMALGRTFFIFMNHGAWRIAHGLFDLSPENAFLLFKYIVVALAPLAVVACWYLAREVSGSLQTATIASLLIATSPFFIIYSGQVMTEIPSIVLLALALLMYLRGVRRDRLWLMLSGAALLGAGVNMRETVGFYVLWLFLAPIASGWRLKRREIFRVLLSVSVFLIVALGPFLFWYLTDSEGYRSAWNGWRESMAMEAARHPFTARSLIAFLVFFFLASPLVLVALPVAAFKEWRRARFSTTLALAVCGLAATLLLLLNYSTSINWRYFLVGLPAIAPLVADYFIRSQRTRFSNQRTAFIGAIAGIALVTVVLGILLKPSRDKFTAQHALMSEYRTRLNDVPRDAVLISGAQSIAVTYWRRIGLGEWDVIGAGSGWPGSELGQVIKSNLDAGRRVIVDTDPKLWPVCGWQEMETRDLVAIERLFRYRHISGSMYEIRPLNDDTARDEAKLDELLPENRGAEREKCAGQGRLS